MFDELSEWFRHHQQICYIVQFGNIIQMTNIRMLNSFTHEEKVLAKKYINMIRLHWQRLESHISMNFYLI